MFSTISNFVTRFGLPFVRLLRKTWIVLSANPYLEDMPCFCEQCGSRLQVNSLRHRYSARTGRMVIGYVFLQCLEHPEHPTPAAYGPSHWNPYKAREWQVASMDEAFRRLENHLGDALFLKTGR